MNFSNRIEFSNQIKLNQIWLQYLNMLEKYDIVCVNNECLSKSGFINSKNDGLLFRI